MGRPHEKDNLIEIDIICTMMFFRHEQCNGKRTSMTSEELPFLQAIFESVDPSRNTVGTGDSKCGREIRFQNGGRLFSPWG